MRVLQLISSAGHYGAESMLLALCQALETFSCQPLLGVISNARKPNSDTVKHARRLGLEVEVFDCKGRLDWNTARKIRNCLQNQNINLIHTHGYKADIYGSAAARGLHIPMVATCHSLPKIQLRNMGLAHSYGFLDRLFIRNFERVVAVSDDLAASLQKRGIRKERLAMIPNGAPIARYASALPTFGEEIGKGKRTVVGMIGRLVCEKGPSVFLQAAQAVLRRFPDTIFVLVGDGPEREQLHKLARDLKIESNVIFAGERRDMPEIYASLDIVVLPSLSEGMPMAILEAMAAGKPVVASRVGAIPRVVLHDRTGLLVKPGDIFGLVEAIERLLTAPALRARLGEEGQKLVSRRFTAETMAESYLGIYREALGAGATA